jgi:hypothetical protein
MLRTNVNEVDVEPLIGMSAWKGWISMSVSTVVLIGTSVLEGRPSMDLTDTTPASQAWTNGVTRPSGSGRKPQVRIRVGLVWAVEHSVETSASARAVWQLLANVERWPEWNAGVERIELRGPFAVGSTILMTPPGDEPVELRIAEGVEPELFVDEADGGDFVVRTTHRVEAVDDERSRITYRMEITGPAAETVGLEIGPEISGDFPQVLAALAARAEGRT